MINKINVPDISVRKMSKKLDLGKFFRSENANERFAFMGGDVGIQWIVNPIASNIVYMLGELIDNSIEHRGIDNLIIKIEVNRERETVTYFDNAKGLTNLYKSFHQGHNKVEDDKDGLSRFGTGMKTALAWFSDFSTIQTKSSDELFGGNYAAQLSIDWKEIRETELRYALNDSITATDLVSSVDIYDLAKQHETLSEYETFTIFEISKWKNNIKNEESHNWQFDDSFNVNHMKKAILKLRERFSRAINMHDIQIEFSYIDDAKKAWRPGMRHFAPGSYMELLKHQSFLDSFYNVPSEFWKNELDFNYNILNRSNCPIDVDSEKTFDFSFLANNPKIENGHQFDFRLSDEIILNENLKYKTTEQINATLGEEYLKKFAYELATRSFFKDYDKKDEDSIEFDYKNESKFMEKFFKNNEYQFLKGRVESSIKNLKLLITEEEIQDFKDSQEFDSISEIFPDLDRVGKGAYDFTLPFYMAYKIAKGIMKDGKVKLNFKMQSYKIKSELMKDKKYRGKSHDSIPVEEYTVEVNTYINTDMFSMWAQNQMTTNAYKLDHGRNNPYVNRELSAGYSLIQNDRSIIHGLNEIDELKILKAQEDDTSNYNAAVNYNNKAGLLTLTNRNKNNLFKYHTQGGAKSSFASYIYGNITIPNAYKAIVQNKAKASNEIFELIVKDVLEVLRYSFFEIHVETIFGIHNPPKSVIKGVERNLNDIEKGQKSILKISAAWAIENALEYDYTSLIIGNGSGSLKGELAKLRYIFSKHIIDNQNHSSDSAPEALILEDKKFGTIEKLNTKEGLKEISNSLKLGIDGLDWYIGTLQFKFPKGLEKCAVSVFKTSQNTKNFEMISFNNSNHFVFLISDKYFKHRKINDVKGYKVDKDPYYIHIRDILIPTLLDLKVQKRENEYLALRQAYVQIYKDEY